MAERPDKTPMKSYFEELYDLKTSHHLSQIERTQEKELLSEERMILKVHKNLSTNSS